MTIFINNIELFLTAAGLLLIGLMPWLLPQYSVWQVVALTALTTSLLHGFIFWSVRRRQRHVRERTIQEIRQMLKDVVTNQLTVLQLSVALSQQRPERSETALMRARKSIGDIDNALNALSSESLQQWQQSQTASLRNMLEDEVRQHMQKSRVL